MAAKDDGLGWRTDIIPHITVLGYDVFNPPVDQPLLTGVSKPLLLDLMKKDLTKYQEACTKIVDADLKALSKCSLLIAKIDEGVLRGSGTFGELTVAHMLKIPVLAWIDLPEGVTTIPSWAFGCITHYTVHERDFYKLIPSAHVLDSLNVKTKTDAWDHWFSET